MATATNGSIYSFGYEPYYEWQVWITDETEPFALYVVGHCMEISERDAAISLCHYPIGEQA